MAETSLFVALSSRRIAELIGQATRHVCYAAPGIQDEPAAALIALAARTPTIGITVNLDFHERTLRMGYGSLPAEYRSWQRVVGLYPLTAGVFAHGIQRWQNEVRRVFAREVATLPVDRRLVRFAPAPLSSPLASSEVSSSIGKK